MTTQEALELVTYKMALKDADVAKADTVLIPSIIDKAIADQAEGTPEKVDLKAYMAATKIVKQHRLDLAKQAGEDYLKENAKAVGIQTTTSGLQYKVVKKADGAVPTIEDTVTVHYHGTLIDGTVFDSSVDRDKAATFAVNKVIDGWKEGLQLMQLGTTYQFFIPQDLAYGDHGSGSQVPPFATLIFEVTLLEIN